VRTETEDLLRERLGREQSEQRLPSVVGALVRDGLLVWSAGAGRVGSAVPDADVQYRCGSITKTFVAVQVMRLRDEGRVELTDALERHLPGAFDGVTIAQLLSHSAGLRAETAGPWWERTAGGDFADLAAASLYPSDTAESAGVPGSDAHPARLARPGRRFHYSNVGFALLGELVSRRRGAPWPDTLRQELLDPLGMTRTTVRPQDPHAAGFAVHPYADLLLPEPEHDAAAMAPAGQLWTTATDLARWMAFLAGYPVGRDSATTGAGELLSPATLAEMREPQAVDDQRGAPWTGAHGLGLQVWNSGGVRTFGHGGSMPGFLAMMRIAEATGDGTLVMANSTSGLRASLSDDLARILSDGEPRPVREWVPAAPAEGTLEALGRWFWGPWPYTLAAVGSSELTLQPDPGGGRAARFRPRDDGTWTGRDGYFTGEKLRLVRAEDGTPVALDVASFIFTRAPYDPQADIPGGVDPRGWHAPTGEEPG
jgi:CubicO group peptidase (beta-lactamase class C family)